MKTIIYSPEIETSRKLVLEKEEYVEEAAASYSASSNHDSSNHQDKVDSVEHRKILQLTEENKSLQQELDELKSTYGQVLADLEENRKQAKDDGYSDGIKLANKKNEEDIEPLKLAWEGATKTLKTLASDALIDKEEECVEVVYASVCRIIGQLATDKKQIISIVKEVMGGLSTPDNQTVYVSSRDYENLEAYSEFIDAHVTPSDEVKYGGCIIKAGLGSLDGRLELQLQKLKELLLQVHQESSTVKNKSDG